MNAVGAIDAGRQDLRRRSGRGALRRRRHAAPSARAAGVARSGGQRSSTCCARSRPTSSRWSAAPDGVPEKLDDLPACGHQQLGYGDPSRRRARPRSKISSSRAAAWCGSRGEHNVYVEKKGQPEDAAGAHAARQARAAALAGRHGGGADHRQIVVHGRPQDRAGAAGGHRRGGEPAAHRLGGRADLRQLVPVGRAASARPTTAPPSSA